MGKIDFQKEARTIDRLVRGMNPWPSAYTYYKGKQLKIWKACPIDAKQAKEYANGVLPGSVVKVAKDSFEVATGDGVLPVLELQLEGKKRMNTHDFLLGVKVSIGDVLGE